MLKAYFSGEVRSHSTYCNKQLSRERRKLSALGRFVSYHLLCCFSLREATRDWYFMRITQAYRVLELCHGLEYGQEPIFSHKSCVLNEDTDCRFLCLRNVSVVFVRRYLSQHRLLTDCDMSQWK